MRPPMQRRADHGDGGAKSDAHVMDDRRTQAQRVREASRE